MRDARCPGVENYKTPIIIDKICPSCGYQPEDQSSKFCSECGTKY